MCALWSLSAGAAAVLLWVQLRDVHSRAHFGAWEQVPLQAAAGYEHVRIGACVLVPLQGVAARCLWQRSLMPLPFFFIWV